MKVTLEIPMFTLSLNKIYLVTIVKMKVKLTQLEQNKILNSQLSNDNNGPAMLMHPLSVRIISVESVKRNC